jgi:hypothetical protein
MFFEQHDSLRGFSADCPAAARALHGKLSQPLHWRERLGRADVFPCELT